MEKKLHNSNKTCWNCPAAKLRGNIDLCACGHSKGKNIKDYKDAKIECRRRPDLGKFKPDITFEECPEWKKTDYGYLLKDMRVMVLGMDGYLGWTLALKLASLGCQVSGVDNYLRRDAVMERGAHTIVPISRMTDRIHTAKKVLDYDINFRKIDILDLPKLREFIDEVKPEAIVHYGEFPSAPHSMVDAEHALFVQKNNVLGTLGLLWIMKDIVPESSLIKLGTMGEYGSPLSGRPIFEGMFPDDAFLKWDDREWSLGGDIVPRDPVSFYHISKVQDTFNILGACKYWGLRSVDVMQGIIFGVHTDQVAADESLRTRFDVDDWFGTVINRFVSQAVIGYPLTIFGSGQQIKGFIALDDAMECMVRLISSPPVPGEYEVVNQLSEVHKLSELAEVVAKVGKEKFDLDVKIQRVENPRVEAEKHPIEIVARNLPNKYGYKPKVTLEQEITRMFELLTRPEIKERIIEKKHTIMPKTWWSGEKKETAVLEVYEPGKKKEDGYKGKLDCE